MDEIDGLETGMDLVESLWSDDGEGFIAILEF